MSNKTLTLNRIANELYAPEFSQNAVCLGERAVQSDHNPLMYFYYEVYQIAKGKYKGKYALRIANNKNDADPLAILVSESTGKKALDIIKQDEFLETHESWFARQMGL